MSSPQDQENIGRVLREFIPPGPRARHLTRILQPLPDGQYSIPGGICTYETDGQGGWRRYLMRTATRSQVNHPAHILAPGVALSGELTDISISGCAIRLEGPCPEELRTGLLSIPLPGRSCQLTFTVRWQIVISREETMMGFQVTPVTSQDGAAWFELVTPALFPQTRAVKEPELDALWRVLSQRYFQISDKTAADFAALRPSFLQANRALADNPLLGHAVLWPGEGTIAFLGSYTHCFVGHQIARVSDAESRVPAKKVLRELYAHSFERTLIHPGLRWISGLVSRGSAWMRLHTQYARPLGIGAFTSPLRLIEIACAPQVATPDGVRVTPFEDTSAEANRLLMAAGRRGHPYADSLDLTVDNLGLALVKRRFQIAGLERERHLLAATVQGRQIALAVLDAVPSGVNLFFIHDAVRIFLVDPSADTATWILAMQALLGAAQAWFAAHGRACFAFISEEDGDTLPPGLGPFAHHDSGAGDYWILAASRVPDFLEHIHEKTALQQQELENAG